MKISGQETDGRERRTPKLLRAQIKARRAFNRIPLRENQKIYILTLLIGGLCGLAAVFFHMLLDFLQTHVIHAAVASPHWWCIPALILLPTVGGLIAGAGLYFLAPEARGSGIPQINAAFYLESGRIPARVIPAKMILAAINIGFGASLGREGPTVQICATIASVLGRIFTISRRRLQSLIPIGAAAGLAAAFNTPIAAVTFTLERAILGEHPIFNVPAYKLGASVLEAINKNRELAYPDQTLDSAMIKLGQKGLSELVVVSRRDPTNLLGIISLRDIAAALSREDNADRQESLSTNFAHLL